MAAHAAGDVEADAHRDVTTEDDLADVAAQRVTDLAELDIPDGAEASPADIREVAAVDEPVQLARAEDDWTTVPTADQTAAAVARARRALAELEQRRMYEDAHTAEEARNTELARWHEEDVTASARDQVDVRTPEMAYGVE